MRQTPTVAMLIPYPTRAEVLTGDMERRLGSIARVVSTPEQDPDRWDLRAMLTGADACLTGWGTPALSDELLASVPTIKFVAHTGASIRRLVPRAAIERGLILSHASSMIADAVAEMVVLQALLHVRRLPDMDRAIKHGAAWQETFDRYLGRQLGALTVGIVGASHVGRAVIRLLKAFGSRVRVYDPTLTQIEASRLGVEPVALAELMRSCDVVSLHAPVLAETIGMIGASELARIRKGGLFINTARAALVDNTALLSHLRDGRFSAALDVFEQEPLPDDSELRQLPNVVLSPHAGGHTVDTQFRQGEAMVAELERFFRGEPLRFAVDPAALSIMA